MNQQKLISPSIKTRQQIPILLDQAMVVLHFLKLAILGVSLGVAAGVVPDVSRSLTWMKVSCWSSSRKISFLGFIESMIREKGTTRK